LASHGVDPLIRSDRSSPFVGGAGPSGGTAGAGPSGGSLIEYAGPGASAVPVCRGCSAKFRRRSARFRDIAVPLQWPSSAPSQFLCVLSVQFRLLQL
jgi:hypothetical protein